MGYINFLLPTQNYTFFRKKQHFPNILLKFSHPNHPFLKNHAIYINFRHKLGTKKAQSSQLCAF